MIFEPVNLTEHWYKPRMSLREYRDVTPQQYISSLPRYIRRCIRAGVRPRVQLVRQRSPGTRNRGIYILQPTREIIGRFDDDVGLDTLSHVNLQSWNEESSKIIDEKIGEKK